MMGKDTLFDAESLFYQSMWISISPRVIRPKSNVTTNIVKVNVRFLRPKQITQSSEYTYKEYWQAR